MNSSIEKRKEEDDDRYNRIDERIAHMEGKLSRQTRQVKLKLVSSTKFMKTRIMIKPKQQGSMETQLNKKLNNC